MSHQEVSQQQNLPINIQPADIQPDPLSSKITTTLTYYISEIDGIFSTIKIKKKSIEKMQEMLTAKQENLMEEQTNLMTEQANLRKLTEKVWSDLEEISPMILLGMKLTFYELDKLIGNSELLLTKLFEKNNLTQEVKIEDLIKLSEMMKISDENLMEFRKWTELVDTAKKILEEKYVNLLSK